MSRVAVAPISEYTADAAYVAEHMREEDVAELWQLSRTTPEAALRSSISLSREAYVASVAGEPIALFGASAPVIGRHGVPWLLGTRLVDQHQREYAELARSFTAHMLLTCDVLENVALAANRRSLVFLKRVGFDIGKPTRLATGVEAVLFRMEAKRDV